MAFGDITKNYQQNIYEQYYKLGQGLKKPEQQATQNPAINGEGANSVTFNPFAPVQGTQGIGRTEGINPKQGLISRIDRLDPPPIDTRTPEQGQRLYIEKA